MIIKLREKKDFLFVKIAFVLYVEVLVSFDMRILGE